MHMTGFNAEESYSLRFRIICSKGQGPWSPTHYPNLHVALIFNCDTPCRPQPAVGIASYERGVIVG
jgi:hypothetical protein